MLEVLATSTPPMPALADGEGWQSGHALHECVDLQPLVMRINDSVRDVLDFQNIGNAPFGSQAARPAETPSAGNSAVNALVSHLIEEVQV